MSFYARLIRHKPCDMPDAVFAVKILGIQKYDLHRWKQQHEMGHADYLPPKRFVLQCSKALGVDPALLSFDQEEREASGVATN